MTEEQYKEISKWQTETFRQANPLSKIAHLIEETVELKDAILLENKIPTSTNFNNVRMEYADCFFLLFGSASAYGFSHKDICDLIQEKFEINKKRNWGKPDRDGIVKHIKQ